MVKTASNMIPIGTKAPLFDLLDTVSNKQISLDSLEIARGLAVLFICNHCPYVIHINPMLVKIANEYQAKGITFIAISSNDAENYPADSPELMKKQAEDLAYPFPYLYDETQEVAKAYHAACTPDLYLFDKHLSLTYRGQFDSSRPGNGIDVTGNDFRHAMDALLNNQDLPFEQKPSLGCNIKWKLE